MEGLIVYGVFTLTNIAIFGLLVLGLNIHWGMTGVINIGVAGFYAVGAYTSAILITEPTGIHLGGYGFPFAVGVIGAMVVSGLIALLIGLITLKLRTDYLAIATIGIAEILRLFFQNEAWLTNGVRGLPSIPKPFADHLSSWHTNVVFMAIAVATLVLVYLALQRLARSPWGRVLLALRDNEDAALAAGKNATSFRLQGFVLGSMLMGMAGSFYASFVGFISPEAFDPMVATFLIWVMLIAGGSGNNRGALAGVVVIWMLWILSEPLLRQLPADLITQVSPLRMILIGLVLCLILVYRPQGLLPERPRKPIE